MKITLTLIAALMAYEANALFDSSSSTWSNQQTGGGVTNSPSNGGAGPSTSSSGNSGPGGASTGGSGYVKPIPSSHNHPENSPRKSMSRVPDLRMNPAQLTQIYRSFNMGGIGDGSTGGSAAGGQGATVAPVAQASNQGGNAAPESNVSSGGSASQSNIGANGGSASGSASNGQIEADTNANGGTGGSNGNFGESCDNTHTHTHF